MSPKFALVQFLLDKSRKIVPLSDFTTFQPKSSTDFKKTKLQKVFWPQEDDKENLALYERSVYDCTVLELADSKDDFNINKRIAGVNLNLLESASSESEADITSNKFASCTSLKNKRPELLNTLERNLSGSPHISKINETVENDSDDSDHEVTISRKRIYEYMKEISDQKKKIKLLESKVESLERQQHSNSTLEDVTLRSLGEETCFSFTNSHEKIIQKIQEMINLFQENKSMTPVNKETYANNKTYEKKEIIFGSVTIPEAVFNVISRREKHSLFIKDLANLLWDEDDLVNRSVSGKKWLKSEESKKPLTPEKLVAMKDAFKERLLKQQYDNFSAERELKLMNRYIAEKICDVRKSKIKKSLTFVTNVTP